MDLNAGNISALDWIDCNGTEDDEINVNHFGFYSSTSQNSCRETDTLLENMVRESGDGDSGEEVNVPSDSLRKDDSLVYSTHESNPECNVDTKLELNITDADFDFASNRKDSGVLNKKRALLSNDDDNISVSTDDEVERIIFKESIPHSLKYVTNKCVNTPITVNSEHFCSINTSLFNDNNIDSQIKHNRGNVNLLKTEHISRYNNSVVSDKVTNCDYKTVKVSPLLAKKKSRSLLSLERVNKDENLYFQGKRRASEELCRDSNAKSNLFKFRYHSDSCLYTDSKDPGNQTLSSTSINCSLCQSIYEKYRFVKNNNIHSLTLINNGYNEKTRCDTQFCEKDRIHSKEELLTLTELIQKLIPNMEYLMKSFWLKQRRHIDPKRQHQLGSDLLQLTRLFQELVPNVDFLIKSFKQDNFARRIKNTSPREMRDIFDDFQTVSRMTENPQLCPSSPSATKLSSSSEASLSPRAPIASVEDDGDDDMNSCNNQEEELNVEISDEYILEAPVEFRNGNEKTNICYYNNENTPTETTSEVVPSECGTFLARSKDCEQESVYDCCEFVPERDNKLNLKKLIFQPGCVHDENILNSYKCCGFVYNEDVNDVKLGRLLHEMKCSCRSDFENCHHSSRIMRDDIANSTVDSGIKREQVKFQKPNEISVNNTCCVHTSYGVKNTSEHIHNMNEQVGEGHVEFPSLAGLHNSIVLSQRNSEVADNYSRPILTQPEVRSVASGAAVRSVQGASVTDKCISIPSEVKREEGVEKDSRLSNHLIVRLKQSASHRTGVVSNKNDGGEAVNVMHINDRYNNDNNNKNNDNTIDNSAHNNVIHGDMPVTVIDSDRGGESLQDNSRTQSDHNDLFTSVGYQLSPLGTFDSVGVEIAKKCLVLCKRLLEEEITDAKYLYSDDNVSAICHENDSTNRRVVESESCSHADNSSINRHLTLGKSSRKEHNCKRNEKNESASNSIPHFCWMQNERELIMTEFCRLQCYLQKFINATNIMSTVEIDPNDKRTVDNSQSNFNECTTFDENANGSPDENKTCRRMSKNNRDISDFANGSHTRETSDDKNIEKRVIRDALNFDDTLHHTRRNNSHVYTNTNQCARALNSGVDFADNRFMATNKDDNRDGGVVVELNGTLADVTSILCQPRDRITATSNGENDALRIGTLSGVCSSHRDISHKYTCSENSQQSCDLKCFGIDPSRVLYCGKADVSCTKSTDKIKRIQQVQNEETSVESTTIENSNNDRLTVESTSGKNAFHGPNSSAEGILEERLSRRSVKESPDASVHKLKPSLGPKCNDDTISVNNVSDGAVKLESISSTVKRATERGGGEDEADRDLHNSVPTTAADTGGAASKCGGFGEIVSATATSLSSITRVSACECRSVCEPPTITGALASAPTTSIEAGEPASAAAAQAPRRSSRDSTVELRTGAASSSLSVSPGDNTTQHCNRTSITFARSPSKFDITDDLCNKHSGTRDSSCEKQCADKKYRICDRVFPSACIPRYCDECSKNDSATIIDALTRTFDDELKVKCKCTNLFDIGEKCVLEECKHILNNIIEECFLYSETNNNRKTNVHSISNRTEIEKSNLEKRLIKLKNNSANPCSAIDSGSNRKIIQDLNKRNLQENIFQKSTSDVSQTDGERVERESVSTRTTEEKHSSRLNNFPELLPNHRPNDQKVSSSNASSLRQTENRSQLNISPDISSNSSAIFRNKDSNSCNIESHILISSESNRVSESVLSTNESIEKGLNLKIAQGAQGETVNDVDSIIIKDILCSKDINKGNFEGRSRLKRLENKLKQAAGVVNENVSSSLANRTESGKCKTENGDDGIETLKINRADSKTCIGSSIDERRVVENETVVTGANTSATRKKNPCDNENNNNIASSTEQVVDKSVQGLLKENVNSRRNKEPVREFSFDNDRRDDLYEGKDEDFAPPYVDKSEKGEVSPIEADPAVDNDFYFGGCCEFDVNKVDAFGQYTDSDFYLVYDELEDEVDSDESYERKIDSSEDEEHHRIIGCVQQRKQIEGRVAAMRGDGGTTTVGEGGGGDERAAKRHNPDHENLKSLLKKPSKGRDSGVGSGAGASGKKNRVVFNEKRNEFFDADYIILIREECDYDEEDDEGVCTCNQHEMVRLTCCEPNCNCNAGYDSYPEQTPPSPKFAPPIEFVDAVTLSPPEGYKDMDLGEQQLAAAALQQLARQRAAAQHQQLGAVCKDCSQQQRHDSDSESRSDEDVDDVSCPYTPRSQPPTGEISKTDQSQQTTPTTPTSPEVVPQSTQQQRYILETITMTTVTERRIVREASEESGPDMNNEENTTCTATNTNGEDQDEVDSSPHLSVCYSPTLNRNQPPISGSPISGILKGGRLWKQNPTPVTSSCGNVEIPTPNVQVPEVQQNNQLIETTFSAENDDSTTRRSVRFIESNEDKQNSCINEINNVIMNEEEESKSKLNDNIDNAKEHETDNCNNSISPDSTEMMLTFKLGNHILISNNSLRPNSAVRQLFPCTNTLIGDDETGHHYLITAESLRAFEEAKKLKLPPTLQGDTSDDASIRKTIERNTLRRSLIRYEPRIKKTPPKTDNSLVERIKQLTCDVDEDISPCVEEQPIIDEQDEITSMRASPPGEESRKSPEVMPSLLTNKNILQIDKNSFSPSSSSTTSSNSSVSSTYKKITDLFAKKHERPLSQAETQTNNTYSTIDANSNKQNSTQTVAPDLGNGGNKNPDFVEPQCAVSKYNVTHEARKQFLSTLAPLTACVIGVGTHDDHYYQLSGQPSGERVSMASSVGTEYSLEDIDAALKTDNNEEPKRVAPDVLVGTPSASESGDELAMFVQQDANRIERIKKRYQSETSANEEDDEHDDYGFNRRPSVRGIKPRFSSTNEILQQMQSQLQPPTSSQQRPASQMSWPYYSETSLSSMQDNNKTSRTSQTMLNRVNKEDSGSEYSLPINNVPSTNVSQEQKYDVYAQSHYQYLPDNRTYRGPCRPNSLVEDSIFQNCTNQHCSQHYISHHPTVMRIGGGGCSDFYQTLPSRRSGRPESPPPMEVARNYHQTMVLIPYNHIEGYYSSNTLPNSHYSTTDQGNYSRVPPPKIKPPQPPHTLGIRPPSAVITQKVEETHVTYQCNTNSLITVGPKQMIRVPYSSGQPVQVHLMTSRSESPQLTGQFATARATQTPVATISSSNYYPPPNTRYRPAIGSVNTLPYNTAMWHNHDIYSGKINRHSGNYASTVPIRPMTDEVQVNGYRTVQTESHYSLPRDSTPNSPTKSRFTSERGVPEGAASISPQDSFTVRHSSSNIVSPTAPQNPPTSSTKPMYYAMNV